MSRNHRAIEGDPAFSPRSVTRRDALRFLIGAGMFAATALPSVASAETTQEKLDSAQSEYTAAQAKLDEIGQECASLNADLSSTLGQIDTTQSAIDQKQTEIDAKQGQIDQKQTEVEAKQTQLGERMSSAYKTGNQSILDLILSSSSFEELTSNIYYLDKVTEADKAMIEEIKTMKAELETEQAELQTEKDDLETQMSALEDLKTQQQQQLSDIQAKQDEAQTYVSQLDSQVQALISQRDSELLAAQQEAARVAAARAAAASSGSSSGGSSSGGFSSGGSSSRRSGSSGGLSSRRRRDLLPRVRVLRAPWVLNVFFQRGVGSFYGQTPATCYLRRGARGSNLVHPDRHDRGRCRGGAVTASGPPSLYGPISGASTGRGWPRVRHCASRRRQVRQSLLRRDQRVRGSPTTPRWGLARGVGWLS